MKRVLIVVTMAAFSAAAQGQLQFHYSTDIGSDLDLSDPTSPANNVMDAGDAYLESAPTLIKNDTLGGPNAGFPFIVANQPPPLLIGSNPLATPTQVTNQYSQYFDLDGEDQLGLLEFELPTEPIFLNGISREQQAAMGIHFEPTSLYFSADDDTAAGWYKSGNIPTTSLPDRGGAPANDEIMAAAGSFGQWAGTTGVRDEQALGLGPNPGATTDDDDVDALDLEQHRYWYWTADHEANNGTDPGGIYVTDLQLPGPNSLKILDDTLNLGLPQDTDVDAFEFVSVSEATFIGLFGYDPGLPGTNNVDLMVILFSVDENDPDNDGLAPDDVNGDESGGLNAATVYASDMLGMNVALVTLNVDDIDGLAVIPEPGNFASLAALALAALALRRLRRKA